MKPQYNECLCFIIGLNGCFSVFLSGCKSLQRTSSARTRFLRACLRVADYRHHHPFSWVRRVLRPRRVHMNWIQSVLHQMQHRMRLRSWLPMVADATTALLPAVGSLRNFLHPMLSVSLLHEIRYLKMKSVNRKLLCRIPLILNDSPSTRNSGRG